MSLTATGLRNRFTLRAKFRHMQVLVTLAELGSMRRAATALNMTQPAISQMVAELERLVEADLFQRHARGVTLNDAGKELLPAAQSVLATLGDAAERMTSRMQTGAGVVRLATSPAASGALLHGRLAHFAVRFPDTHLQILTHDFETSASSLTGQGFDIICTRKPHVVSEGWQFTACMADGLTVVGHSSHPLAGKPSVSPADLGQATWLSHRVGSIARDRLEDAARRFDWPSLNLCRINTHIPELTHDLLADGTRLALMPRSVVLPWLRTGALVALDTELTQPLASLGCLWKPDDCSKATRRAVEFFAQTTADEGAAAV
ncbi:hypothetical protein AN189_15040 [Loktanella sp. 3ANDIMAR09]|uniref:LysR family transcriptional regulator n=1 Tax=Loktanella sp. 3ANDIMAR09 TaxID=1225657 RepID=UPI0006F5A4F3|nr:LysR family transcriptional regulator [Loktanella sp. 3ANDIMAR09]KQI67457.1 hypothetical protein AN189_15040 [Loktanella sp. 3ANDIMAR09]